MIKQTVASSPSIIKPNLTYAMAIRNKNSTSDNKLHNLTRLGMSSSLHEDSLPTRPECLYICYVMLSASYLQVTKV